MTLKLSFACNEYDRTVPLRTGDVRPRGIHLDFVVLPPEQTFLRQLRDKEFDVSEMSMSAYVQMRARGEADFIALPVFPSRILRHSAIYVRAGSDLRHPNQLRGRRIGIGYYQMSAAVWVRGMLKDEYGVSHEELEWVSGMDVKPDREASEVVQLHDMVQGTKNMKPKLEVMLENGEIDALISVHIPRSMVRGEGLVRHLFDPVRPVEEDYVRRTGIFPMMHTIALRRSIHDEHPWVAQSLFDAFSDAKNLAFERLYDTNALSVMLPFLISEMDRTRDIMGYDYWPYGLEPNRMVVATFARYLHEQGITDRRMDPSELFADVSATQAPDEARPYAR